MKAMCIKQVLDMLRVDEDSDEEDFAESQPNIQGGPKVGIQLLKVGFGSKSRFVVLM